MKAVCVFCSSSNNISQEYFEAAEALAELIVKNHYSLIHGGGSVGLMGCLSRNVKSLEGYVIGIIPERLNVSGIVSEIDDELIVTPDMHTRKALMREKANVFIALPGGYGTLEELLEIITLKQLGYIKSEIIILNLSGFFDKLLSLFDEMLSGKFISVEDCRLYSEVRNVKEIKKYLK